MNPILKWAGGKSKVFQYFSNIYNYSTHKRYIDLFCGSLSLPLQLAPKNAVFNDINSSLINVYKIIQKSPESLIEQLEDVNKDSYNTKEKFEELRKEYNDTILSSETEIRHAVLFIYLNKRSFNGLYRENSSGKYNVPYRKYNTSIYNKNNIMALSVYFRENCIQFFSQDFREFSLDFFNKDDLVYIDPPYYSSEKSKFVSYWRRPFLIKDQHALREFCKKLDNKGVQIILSNSPCKEIKDMYSDFFQYCFYIGRQMRNAKGKSKVFENKKEANEILLWNYSIIDFEN